MRKFEAIVLAALAGAVIMGLARSQDFGRLTRDRDATRDSLTVVRAERDVLADSLGRVAHKADTVRVEVERTAYVEVERARADGQAAADSLRASLDSAQAVLFANDEANDEAEKAALRRIADANLAWGMDWRNAALASDSARAADNALHTFVNAGLRSALIAEKQQVWLSRGALAVGMVAVLVLK